MKISALLSLAFACTVSASTYGQNYKLSMNKQDCSISEVLKEIEKNSEYTFFLNDNQVNVNRKTSVKANNASLEEVLEQALKNTGYQYEIVDRQIIIKSFKCLTSECLIPVFATKDYRASKRCLGRTHYRGECCR